MTPEANANAAIQEERFNRHNEKHINMVKGLYYAWYGPKDAQAYLTENGISISVSSVTQLFYNFRAAKLTRADRSQLLQEYTTLVTEA